jgi:hypothetical protein
MDREGWKQDLLITVLVVVLLGWLALVAYCLADQVPSNVR